MKKTLILLFITLASCASVKDAMNLWIGHSKQEVVLKWGPPNSVASDGNKGEVYIYSTQCSRLNGQVYWYNRMLYLNENEKVYYWMVKEENVPPTQIDIRSYRRI